MAVTVALVVSLAWPIFVAGLVFPPIAGWVLAFALSCWLASAYGFLQGAWPFGLVEAIWGLVAVQRWRRARAAT